MTRFSRPIGLREWLQSLEARIARLEAGGVRGIQEESALAERAVRTESVPRERGNLTEYLRRHRG